jgi:DMSO/TMAO reductase YedYZ molybdopterin-dependent catalytic subunit
MNRISEGFTGRQATARADLPPGQYLTADFPVLSAGPTPDVPRAAWELAITTGSGERHRWDFDALLAAGAEGIEVDLHCVTGWSKFGMAWRGVPVDTLMEQVGDTGAEQVLAHSYGGYTTNMPLEDLLDGQAWLAFEYDGEPTRPRARRTGAVAGSAPLPLEERQVAARAGAERRGHSRLLGGSRLPPLR